MPLDSRGQGDADGNVDGIDDLPFMSMNTLRAVTMVLTTMAVPFTNTIIVAVLQVLGPLPAVIVLESLKLLFEVRSISSPALFRPSDVDLF